MRGRRRPPAASSWLRRAVCAVVSVAFCSVTGAADAPTPAAPAVLTEHGAILSGAGAEAIFSQCSRSAPHDVRSDWTPAVADIARLEERLPAFIAAIEHHPPGGPLTAYRRQYVGFSRGGRRYIYVNAFRHDLSDDDPRPEYRDYWQRIPVVVCDGGTAFFGVEYDVEQGSLANYAANGPYRP